MGGYTATMTDLSALLSTHTEQNSRLRDQNTVMAERMTGLVGETEKRDKLVASMQEEASLQITLLQHQVQKAHIEKAEIKADMTKERLELSQELLLERERSRYYLKEEKEKLELSLQEPGRHSEAAEGAGLLVCRPAGGAAVGRREQHQELPALQDTDREADSVDGTAGEGHQPLETKV
jgi:hypothetical protein